MPWLKKLAEQVNLNLPGDSAADAVAGLKSAADSLPAELRDSRQLIHSWLFVQTFRNILELPGARWSLNELEEDLQRTRPRLLDQLLFHLLSNLPTASKLTPVNWQSLLKQYCTRMNCIHLFPDGKLLADLSCMERVRLLYAVCCWVFGENQQELLLAQKKARSETALPEPHPFWVDLPDRLDEGGQEMRIQPVGWDDGEGKTVYYLVDGTRLYKCTSLLKEDEQEYNYGHEEGEPQWSLEDDSSSWQLICANGQEWDDFMKEMEERVDKILCPPEQASSSNGKAKQRRRKNVVSGPDPVIDLWSQLQLIYDDVKLELKGQQKQMTKKWILDQLPRRSSDRLATDSASTSVSGSTSNLIDYSLSARRSRREQEMEKTRKKAEMAAREEEFRRMRLEATRQHRQRMEQRKKAAQEAELDLLYVMGEWKKGEGGKILKTVEESGARRRARVEARKVLARGLRGGMSARDFDRMMRKEREDSGQDSAGDSREMSVGAEGVDQSKDHDDAEIPPKPPLFEIHKTDFSNHSKKALTRYLLELDDEAAQSEDEQIADWTSKEQARILCALGDEMVLNFDVPDRLKTILATGSYLRRSEPVQYDRLTVSGIAPASRGTRTKAKINPDLLRDDLTVMNAEWLVDFKKYSMDDDPLFKHHLFFILQNLLQNNELQLLVNPLDNATGKDKPPMNWHELIGGENNDEEKVELTLTEMMQKLLLDEYETLNEVLEDFQALGDQIVTVYGPDSRQAKQVVSLMHKEVVRLFIERIEPTLMVPIIDEIQLTKWWIEEQVRRERQQEEEEARLKQEKIDEAKMKKKEALQEQIRQRQAKEAEQRERKRLKDKERRERLKLEKLNQKAASAKRSLEDEDEESGDESSEKRVKMMESQDSASNESSTEEVNND